MKRPPQLPIIIGSGISGGFWPRRPETAVAFPVTTACMAVPADGVVAGIGSFNIIIATQWAT